MLFVCHPKFCISIVFSFSWGHFNSQEKLKTMLMQNFGVTNRDHYGMLWYFLEWSIVQSYFDALLRYVLSVTFCGACSCYESYGPKDTTVKRRWSYEVRRTVYILTLSEFARHEFTNLWLETFSWTLPDTFSLFDRNKTRPKTSKTSEWFNG